MATAGERVRKCRERAGMTLEDVAGLVGVSVEELNDCESGVVSELMWEQLELLASVLGRTMEYLIGYDDGDVIPIKYSQPGHEIMRRRAVEGETKFMDEAEKRAIALESIGDAIKRVFDHNYDLFNAALEIIYLAKGVGLITDEERKGFINDLKKRMEAQK